MHKVATDRNRATTTARTNADQGSTKNALKKVNTFEYRALWFVKRVLNWEAIAKTCMYVRPRSKTSDLAKPHVVAGVDIHSTMQLWRVSITPNRHRAVHAIAADQPTDESEAATAYDPLVIL